MERMILNGSDSYIYIWQLERRLESLIYGSRFMKRYSRHNDGLSIGNYFSVLSILQNHDLPLYSLIRNKLLRVLYQSDCCQILFQRSSALLPTPNLVLYIPSSTHHQLSYNPAIWNSFTYRWQLIWQRIGWCCLQIELCRNLQWI